MLETSLPMDPETRELTPRPLPLTREARTLLVQFSDAIEVQQAPGGDLAHVTGYASKAAEQAARIAGVLTLWRDLHAPEVQARDMMDAISLAQFYLTEAARMAEAATVSAEIDKAERLRKWLVEKWTDPEILPGDILQRAPSQLRDRQAVKKAVVVLVEAGWLIPLEAGTVVRGASRKEAYRIVRG